MVKLKLALVLLLTTIPMVAAARDLESNPPPRFWMDTIYGYQTEALPLVACWPRGDDCTTYENNFPTYAHPILENGVVQLHMEGVVPARTVTLEVFRRIGDGAIDSATFDVDADNPTITWDTDLMPGEYHLRVTAEGAIDGRLTLVLGIERLSNADGRDSYPQPPPVVVKTTDGDVVSLLGGYCFPPDSDEMGCLAYDAPPYPEEFYEIPNNTVSVRMLGRPYPTSVGLWLHGREDWEITANASYLVPNDEQLMLGWTPEDLPAGDYVLTILVDWTLMSDAAYYFGITLTE